MSWEDIGVTYTQHFVGCDDRFSSKRGDILFKFDSLGPLNTINKENDNFLFLLQRRSMFKQLPQCVHESRGARGK